MIGKQAIVVKGEHLKAQGQELTILARSGTIVESLDKRFGFIAVNLQVIK